MDNLTRVGSLAVNIIFAGYPTRTALGVFFGLALFSLSKFFSPLLATLGQSINPSALSALEFSFLGIAILHIQTFYFHLIKKGDFLSESEEKALALIRKAKRAGVKNRDIEKFYFDLCKKALKNAQQKKQARKRAASG